MKKSKKASPKAKSSKVKAGGGLSGVVSAGASVISGLSGGSSKGSSRGGRRRHGVNYWANKVMVEKLKKRYNRIKYGGLR